MQVWEKKWVNLVLEKEMRFAATLNIWLDDGTVKRFYRWVFGGEEPEVVDVEGIGDRVERAGDLKRRPRRAGRPRSAAGGRQLSALGPRPTPPRCFTTADRFVKTNGAGRRTWRSIRLASTIPSHPWVLPGSSPRLDLDSVPLPAR